MLAAKTAVDSTDDSWYRLTVFDITELFISMMFATLFGTIQHEKFEQKNLFTIRTYSVE